jgi:hypothetical protein
MNNPPSKSQDRLLLLIHMQGPVKLEFGSHGCKLVDRTIHCNQRTYQALLNRGKVTQQDKFGRVSAR